MRGRSRGRNQTLLLSRVEEACQRGCCRTLDEVVRYLQATYTDYSRLKQQSLAYNVRPAYIKLRHQNNKNSPPNDNPPEKDEGQGSASCSRKRQLENDYPQRDLVNRSESEIESGSNFYGGLTPCSSSDAIHEDNVEQESDLFKSVLRECYGVCKVDKLKGVDKKSEVEDVRKEKLMPTNEDGKKGGPRFRDLGGMKGVLDELRIKVLLYLCQQEIPPWLGVQPMSGILLHGPPGCGKTTLAHAIANEAGLPFYKISATDVLSSVSGASEENIQELFSKARKTAPSIVFIDEIDVIASKKENLQRETDRRIVTTLMACIDECQSSVRSDLTAGYVFVIGATNRPDALDPAFRRPGRFTREFTLAPPDENARVEILKVLTKNLRLEGHIDLEKVAKATSGFVGADLSDLTIEASYSATERVAVHRRLELSKEPIDGKDEEDWWKKPWPLEDVEKIRITMTDFEEAIKNVQASSKREGFSMTPNVKWEDVGGLDTLRQEFEECIIRPIKHPKSYEISAVELKAGILLFGPPGCGKTLIAKAVAGEAGASFIHVQGPELLNKYVGESELAIRTIFSRARRCSPCIIFFDEVDALTTERGDEGARVVTSLLNQLLVELDGGGSRKGVYVIGATNRPDVMDGALVRPGRLKRVYVSLPSSDGRLSILKALAKKKYIDPSVDLLDIAESCEYFSGADLGQLMNEAARAAIREQISSGSGNSESELDAPPIVKAKHFEEARGKVTPSVSAKQRRWFDRLARKWGLS